MKLNRFIEEVKGNLEEGDNSKKVTSIKDVLRRVKEGKITIERAEFLINKLKTNKKAVKDYGNPMGCVY